MNKITVIRKILKRKDWMTSLFFCNEDYKIKELPEDIMQIDDIQGNFIKHNAMWLYKDKNNIYYGLLENFIVSCNKMGEAQYFCHNFQDIFQFHQYDLKENKLFAKYQKELLKKYQFNYKELEREYIDFSLPYFSLPFEYNEKDFNKMMKEKLKNITLLT